jgi:hypothetical protein
MLTQQQIREALRASRVVPVDVPNPHGPLGLEELAQAVERMEGGAAAEAAGRVRRPLTLPAETWQKLDGMARAASKSASHPVSASDVAAALIERLVAG